MKLDPISIMQCKVCGVDVKVNSKYAAIIKEVTCQDCHKKSKDTQ